MRIGDKRGMSNLLKTGWLVLGCAILVTVSLKGWFPTYGEDGQRLYDPETGHAIKRVIAWPWYAVIGGATSFIFGYLLGGYKPETAEPVNEPG